MEHNAPLADLYDSLLLDLDGVVYVGPEPVPNAAESLNSSQDLGLRITYVTNNASRPPKVVATQLQSMGLNARVDDVMTSAQAGAQLVSEQVEPGSRVLAVGGPGVLEALTEVGLVAVDVMAGTMPDAGDDVVAVLQGFGRDLNWRALARASRAVAGGAIWVATNTDMTIPTEFGIAPGNGTLVQAVATATRTTPEVVGKPFPPLFLGAAKKSGGLKPLVVGDRLDTDILGAANANMPSLMVLTGVSGALDLWRAETDQRPTHLGRDLTALIEPPLLVRAAGDQVICGAAKAQVVDRQLEVSCPEAAEEGIWAAAHLIWRTGILPDNAPEVAQTLSSQLKA